MSFEVPGSDTDLFYICVPPVPVLLQLLSWPLFSTLASILGAVFSGVGLVLMEIPALLLLREEGK